MSYQVVNLNRLLAKIAGLVLPVGLLLVASTVLAEYIPPDQVRVQTERYRPIEVEVASGTYHYDVDWQGLPVASAKVHVEQYQLKGKPYYRVITTAKTAKVIDWVYKLRHQSESLFNAKTLRPLSFFSHQKENRKVKFREVNFSEDGKIYSSRWKKGEERKNLNFSTQNATFDPITAAFLARTMPIHEGASGTFDVYNGKHRFLITMTVVGKEEVSISGETRLAYKVEPEVRRLTDTKGETKLKSAHIWVAADGSRDLLLLKSKVFIGSVNAELVDFTPEPVKIPSQSPTVRVMLSQAKVARIVR